MDTTIPRNTAGTAVANDNAASDREPSRRKQAAANLVKAITAKGMRATADGKRLSVTAHLNGASQAVVLRGESGDVRWCMVWEPFRAEEAPEIEPILPIGQEQVLAGRLLKVLELAQIQV
ncbi:hypothetical protein SAMN02745673_01721 [Marinactinospora thermotolerans DSM 45154]|uniref:Uncharacterized protein n=1 Tax=Marinactinospora thermotolerans DSM 45154 TaxID=1122192 RepID=A0A1T4PBC6_9ACTN|nr:hypothetical protein [Marinactinospora thermotolerans]SJZ88865.1 hypothetical protein SAMN02745673_01721 [Marinactinospora thermotolerans DSM 45154]